MVSFSRISAMSPTTWCRRPAFARWSAPISSSPEPGSTAGCFRSCIRSGVNEIRSRRVRQGQGFVDAGETLTFDGAHDTETHVMAGQVLKQVYALPEAQRTVIFLAYVEGLSYREVAGILDIPIGTVMSRLAAARAKLSGAGSEGGRQ
ncbi:RNA polymerase sigma factor (sigma-70 family) [Rhizobium leguminosarum]